MEKIDSPWDKIAIYFRETLQGSGPHKKMNPKLFFTRDVIAPDTLPMVMFQ